MSDSGDTEYLTPAEAARARRRDRDMSAEGDALMRPGPAKFYKQVGDLWQKQAKDGVTPRKGGKPKRKRAR